MKLIGMLDSPFVRRVAISMRLLGLPFEHAAVSVFRGFDAFQRINPVVKAPTLVCDDGSVLMDSTLMLIYAEALAGRSLMPNAPTELTRELRLIGLALAACEKTAQIVYESGLRPAEKQHAPWVERVTGQLTAAYRELDSDVAARAAGRERGRPAPVGPDGRRGLDLHAVHAAGGRAGGGHAASGGARGGGRATAGLPGHSLRRRQAAELMAARRPAPQTACVFIQDGDA